MAITLAIVEKQKLLAESRIMNFPVSIFGAHLRDFLKSPEYHRLIPSCATCSISPHKQNTHEYDH